MTYKEFACRIEENFLKLTLANSLEQAEFNTVFVQQEKKYCVRFEPRPQPTF
jgi:hypothetical protein